MSCSRIARPLSTWIAKGRSDSRRGVWRNTRSIECDLWLDRRQDGVALHRDGGSDSARYGLDAHIEQNDEREVNKSVPHPREGAGQSGQTPCEIRYIIFWWWGR